MALDENDKQWIDERLEAMETRLLRAFHEWASPADAKVRSHSAGLHALDLEIEALKNRVERLEHGKA